MARQLRSDRGREQHLQALEQGRYSGYLRPYFEQFGAERVHIVFYEELASDPAAVMNDLCLFAKLDPHFYRAYDFRVFNKTAAMRSSTLHGLYTRTRFRIRQYTHNKPVVHDLLRGIKAAVEPVYMRLNTRRRRNQDLSPSVRSLLDDYYRQEIGILAEMTGRPVPWNLTGSPAE